MSTGEGIIQILVRIDHKPLDDFERFSFMPVEPRRAALIASEEIRRVIETKIPTGHHAYVSMSVDGFRRREEGDAEGN